MGNGSYTTVGLPDISSVTGVVTSLLGPAPTVSQSGQTITANTAAFTADSVGWFILTPSTNVLCAITGYTDAQHVTVASSQSIPNVSYILSQGPAGFQQLDTGVADTLIRKENFYYYGNAIPTAEAIGTDTLPDSLFRSAKPDWFGNLAWPAFDPTAPAPSKMSIPAGVRFMTGADPISSTTTTVAMQMPINVRVRE
jgi:hypothetical protein